MRSSSGRACGSDAISSGSSMRISAKLAMARSPSSLLNRQVRRGHGAGRLRRTLTKIQWREGLLLVQFELALTHQLQRGGKAGGKYCGALRVVGDVVHQVAVE